MKQTIESMTTKRQYARPQMTVVELRQKCHILAGSTKSGDQMEDNTEINVIYDQEDI